MNNNTDPNRPYIDMQYRMSKSRRKRNLELLQVLALGVLVFLALETILRAF